MFGKIKSASRIKHFIEISLVTSFVLVIWLILNFIVFRSRISNDFKVQTEGFKDQDINSTFSSNKDGIRKDPRNAQTFQVRPVGPTSQEKVRRILWWSTVYGGSSGFFAVGDGKDLVSLATKCKCKCEFTVDKTQLESSHGVIFHGWGDDLPVETIFVGDKRVTVPLSAPHPRYENQIYIYMTLEAPQRIRTNLEAYKEFFNWTMTYRLDSDFPIPYGRFVRKSPLEAQFYNTGADGVDYIRLLKRAKLAAWMVSNCEDAPSERHKLVQELQKYIPISIYGKCGTNMCNETIDPDCWNELAMSHKFYLSFENSLCKDYVTEKFFNSLRVNMVPVVYGKANYGHQFAPGSFINVDSFASVKALAQYLMYLDGNDEEYLKYFEWRKYYRLHQGWPLQEAYCGVCERLHKENPPAPSKLDINDWSFRQNSENRVCDGPRSRF